MSIEHTSIRTTRGSSLTAFVFGELHTITDSNPVFDEVFALLNEPDTSEAEVYDLLTASTSQGVVNQMRNLSARVTYDGTDILFDDEPIHGTVVEHIKSSLIDGTHEWENLAAFLERSSANPSMTSRREMYDWITAAGLVITSDGRFVGYKGLRSDSSSVRDGGAYVNGVWVDGHVPNHVGSRITLDREKVDDDRTISCSHGLHVGTYDYASGWSHGVVATVLVDPADVVSVPADSGCAKLRTWRYEVVKTEKDQATYLGRFGTVSPGDFEDGSDSHDWNDQDDDAPDVHDFTLKPR